MLYSDMAAISPVAVRPRASSRASQHAAPSEKSTAPRTRAMSRPVGESSAKPNNTRTITDGAIASTTSVPASLAFRPAALAGSRAPGCSAPSAAPLAPSAHDPGLNSAQRKPKSTYRKPGSCLRRQAARTPLRDFAPGTAPEDAVGGRRFGRRRASFLGIVSHPNIRAPLPHIPQHVVQAPGIRFLAGDGVDLISAVLVVPRDGIEVFRVTRGLRPRATGILPLSLRGKRQLDTIKPGIQRRQEFLALFPAHRFPRDDPPLPWDDPPP